MMGIYEKTKLEIACYASCLYKAHETELLIRKFLPIFYRKSDKKSMILNKKKGFNCEENDFPHKNAAALYCCSI